MDFRIARLVDYPAVAALVERLNRTPDSHCIQSSTGESVEALLAEMIELEQSGELLWALAMVGERPAGAIGCEYEAEGSRGWLRGPFDDGLGSDDLRRLWELLVENLPPAINRLDAFLNLQNQKGQLFFEILGFEPVGSSHVYRAEGPPPIDSGAVRRCQPLTPEYQAAFVALHDRIFPTTFYRGAQIIEQLDPNHRVWVYPLDGSVGGYVYLTAEAWAVEGYIEFIGVDESCRRRGVGSALLECALGWCFHQRGLPAVSLVVNDDNNNARDLYERCGFKLLYSGVNQRLVRRPP